MSTLKSITLLGSSSGRNAGDAALLSGIMDSVDAACGERLLYEIPTINTDFVWRTYENRVRPVGVLPWNLSLKLLGLPTYQSVMRTDFSLVFDAVLFDRALYNPLFNFLSSFYLLLPRAKRKGKRLGFYNVTAGPVTTRQGRNMLFELSEMMDFITVRDQDSYDILRDIGVQNPNVIVTADAALNARAADDKTVTRIWHNLGFEDEGEVLAINVNAYLDSWAGLDREPMSKEYFIKTYSRALNRVGKELGVPMLFVSTQHLDEALTREVMANVTTAKKKSLLSNRRYDHHVIKGVLSRVGLLFAMRLHCIILASSALSPVSALVYLPKVRHYMKSIGLDRHCMGFDDFSEEALVSAIKQGWEERHNIGAQLRNRIPELQAKANVSAELIATLHRDEDFDAAVQRAKGEL